ncbi:hypothetical protein [Bordetella sp. N]|uniref:hypothetical protein n=1 Tax=Bordetella sp. N TaxID=1746199 RepID=UPI0012E38257|nr:hypothetical protein [Bordetella sp. N]
MLSEAEAGVDAGPEAVARAYEAALLQIDPNSQAEASDNLHAAYATALAWARDRPTSQQANQAQQAHQEQQAHQAQTSAAAAPLHAVTQAEVETALQEWLVPLMDRGQSQPGAVLAQALRDERLASTEAQRALQARIAAVLVQDPGQRAALFDAAVFRFQWDVDNGSQLTDRWTAAWIAQACGESLAWRGQAEADRQRQLEALAAAQACPTPDETLLTRHFFAMDVLMSRFGYWFSLRLPNDALQAWAQAYQAPGFKRPLALKTPAPRARFKFNARIMIIVVLLALAVLRIVFYPNQSPSQQPWPVKPADPASQTEGAAARR